MEGWAPLGIRGMSRDSCAVTCLALSWLYTAKTSTVALVCGLVLGVGQGSVLCTRARLKSLPSFVRKAFTARLSQLDLGYKSMG